MPINFRRFSLYAQSNWLWFGLTFIVFYIHLHFSAFKDGAFYYDSKVYWLSAQELSGENGFTLYDLSLNVLHGCLTAVLYYPAVLAMEHGLLSDVEAVKVTGAIIAALLFGVAGPALWRSFVPGPNLSWKRRLLFIMLGFIFWREYFNFPLSDFPGILALFGAMIAANRLRGYWFGNALLTGLLLALAINMRQIYLMAFPLIIGIWLWNSLRIRKEKVKAAGGMVLILGGFMLGSIPQMIQNIKYYDSYNPLVKTTAPTSTDGENVSVYLWQLDLGMAMHKYETNIGSEYPEAGIEFNDAAGQAILRNESLAHVTSYGEYAQLILHHPVDMLALFGRHLFNGLDVQYTTPYIRWVFRPTLGLALMNYSLQFAGLLLLVFHLRLKQLTIGQYLALGILLLPCLAVIPVAIECRFLLPLQLLLYAGICFGWPPQWHRGAVEPVTRRRLAVVYCLYLFTCLTMSSSFQATMKLQTKIFQP